MPRGCRVYKMNCFGRYRREAGLSQASVSKMLGVSQGAVSEWETGRRYPRVDTLLTVARIYGCSVNDLLNIPTTQGGDDSDGHSQHQQYQHT